MQCTMILALTICLLLCYVYYKFVKPCLYWQKRNVFHVKPWVRFFKVFVDRKSFAEAVKEAYDQFPDRRYFGSYQFLYPSLFIRDLELIKQITVKDFDHFSDHLLIFNSENDPLSSSNLFALKGEKWRDMRSTLSPAFTSSKMRSMFILMAEIAEKYTENLLKGKEDVQNVEMKNLFSKYTNDIIATCAFGIDCDSLTDDKNDFFVMGKAITNFSTIASIRALLIGFFPKICEFFRIRIFPKKVSEFFENTIKDTIAYREREGVIRPDMVHLLLEARRGRLKHESQSQNVQDVGYAIVEESSVGTKVYNKIEITDDVITAQALIFFFAGFETASTVMSFLSYEIALNQEIQKKLHQEVDDVMNKFNGKISYEEMLKLKYVDQVISETLRKYPPGFAMNRVCTKDYTIPPKQANENPLVIEKGCAIVVPVFGLHRDPNYFPEPDKFDPERFSDENKTNIVPGTYLPFGSGPRNCIGSRFALLETKALIVHLLSKFEIHPIEKTVIPLKLTKSVTLGSVGGFWLGLKRRNRTKYD